VINLNPFAFSKGRTMLLIQCSFFLHELSVFLETNDGSLDFNVTEMQSFKLKKIRLLGNAGHFDGDLSTGVIFMKVILAPCFSYFLFLCHQSSFHAKVRNMILKIIFGYRLL
jgi:hypothetical protein